MPDESKNDDNYEGEMYSVNTLCGFMYRINRILKKFGHEYDIGKSVNFRKSQDLYKTAIKELKEFGKGYTKSAEEITENGNFYYFSFHILP